MPDLNHRFQAGRMNKDLDERLVPNGEYRDALNAQVATSDGSDVGTLQNILGNLNISSASFVDPVTGNTMDEAVLETYGFYCVGSIVDEKNDKLYWLVSGIGVDFIAEYDYNTKKVHPIIVDTFQANVLPGAGGRVLNFDKGFLITGINIMEETIFWTDNNTEPKRVNVPQIRLGTVDFLTHTIFHVPNPDKNSTTPYVAVGDLQEDHITVIRKGPNTAPKLEMKNTVVGDTNYNSVSGETTTTLPGPLSGILWDNAFNTYVEGDIILYGAGSATGPAFDTDVDYSVGDFLDIESVDDVTGASKKRKITVEVMNIQSSLTGELMFTVQIRSWDSSFGFDLENESFNVKLQQDSALFKYRFPRFGCRYKYKDGEYSAFSPFSEIAFLPGKFDYLPKEGYNLAMVNTVRALGVCDFVDQRYIPEDVVSIDILYKESNSPAVYSIASVDRVLLDPDNYESWNAITSTTMRDLGLFNPTQTHGYVDIKSEMIHSILPSNQLLRPWDNVPRKALAQEVIGNRVVYANYLQNYNVSSSRTQLPSALPNTLLRRSKNIEVDLNLALKTRDIASSIGVAAEELDAEKAYTYESAKTIKSLRTYQLGVIYIDEFGRETPVFSSSKESRHTAYATKDLAGKATKLAAQIKSPTPDFAKNFKFLVKETSSEYYNLAMDRWYNADDGNIWITFPSADRNKVDLETFLILKKAHKESKAVTDLARYKILDISNEAPRFVKTRVTPIRNIQDGLLSLSNSSPILMSGGNDDINFPFTGGRYVDIHNEAVESVINVFESEVGAAYPFQFRLSSNEGASKWYDIQSFESRLVGTETYWRILSTKRFGDDMGITTPFNVTISPTEPAYANCKVEFIKREEKNLPEFEGRFFVKILKDSELQENLLGYSSYTGDYSVANSIKSQYINPFAEAGNYLSTGGNWYGYDKALISLDSHGQFTNLTPTSFDGIGQGYEYWELAGQTENEDSASSGWFIDAIEAFRPFKYNKRFYEVPSPPGNPNPYEEAINARFGDFNQRTNVHSSTNLATMGTDHPGINNNAWEIWTSAISNNNNQGSVGGNNFGMTLSGVGRDYPRKQLQLIGDCTNATTSGGFQGGSGANYSGYLGIPNVLTPHEGSFNDPTSYPSPKPVLQSANASEGGQIIPARGIDEFNNLIHLSRAGIGWFNPVSADLNTLDNGLSDVKASFWSYLDPTVFSAVDYVNELEFTIAISTPGTIWKWKEDPGQVVYQTQQGAPPSSGITQAEWNASQNDAYDNYQGIMLFNYTKLSDYTTTHVVTLDPNDKCASLSLSTPSRYIPNLASQGIQNYGIIPPNDCSLIDQGGWNGLQGMQDLTFDEYDAFPEQTVDSNGNERWPMYTQSWDQARNKRRRYTIHATPLPNSLQGITGTEGLGGVAPHFYLPTNPTSNAPHFDENGVALDSQHANVLASDAPGIRPDGVYSGREGVVNYDLTVDGTLTTFEKIPSLKMTDGTLNSEAPGSVTWQILEKYESGSGDEDSGYFTSDPAVWETEPKEDLGLEIYHEAGQIYPTELNEETLEQFFGPIHTDLSRNSKVTCKTQVGVPIAISTVSGGDNIRIAGAFFEPITQGVVVSLQDISGTSLSGSAVPPVGSTLIFTRADGSATEINVLGGGPSSFGLFGVQKDAHNYQVTLPWFNAYSFGNGVESNRVRDDYNQITIDKGPKVSTVLEEPYVEERRSSGFIWSGIFNSMSGVNNLNQFIQAEKITKDLNPIHGSIQKLYARNTDLVTLCEDKVFKILANKDALFNADGNVNLTASQNVLGQTIPFSGDYGISTNPESFAADAYRLYFSDRARGSVLRLSQDGLTPISSYGMTDWFADNLSESNRIIGSFDDRKKEYNISLSYYNQKTFPVKIMGHLQQVISLPNTPPSGPPIPMAKLQVRPYIADKFEIGDDITGPGIPIGTTVTNKSYLGGGLWQIGMSHIPTDVSTLGDHVCEDVDCTSLYWDSVVFVSPQNAADPITLSYSEINKGWPSFKSFHYEDALSLNNDYFTFKGGQLYQHHINDVHNNFYGEQYDSSVEVLFNEAPGSVKSFQTLNYEGSQSKITSDGGLNEQSNSGEYWDNYAKLGWYVDNMYTDLQELEPAEFKNKEGKWFSTVKGVATEWLDDGKAGNIDTREFSYQGIDESGAITVIDGGYTSWDCLPIDSTNCADCRGKSLSPLVVPINCSAIPCLNGGTDFFWSNPAVNINNNSFMATIGGVPISGPAVFGCGSNGGSVLDSSAYPNSSINFNGQNDLIGCDQIADPNCGTYHDLIQTLVADEGNSFSVDQVTNTGLNGEIYNTYTLRYTSVNDIVQWFIDNVDGTAFYLGMSLNQFINAGQVSGFMYASVVGNIPADTCATTQQTNTHICTEVQGLTGAYPDKAACEADVNSPCGDPCPIPNVVTAHVTHANAPECDDGGVNVEVYMAGSAASWNVSYVDANGNTTIDNTTYTYNGNSNITSNLLQGVYTAIVRDNLGCTEEVEFVIDCLANPCSNASPHDFKADILLNPAWDKNVNDCWRTSSGVTFGSGEITVSNNSLVAPALMWSVRVYSVVSGISTMIFASTMLYPGTSITIDGLEEGDYEYEIIDDQPCSYPPKPFTLNCIPVVPCVPPMIPQYGWSTTDATSTDGCATSSHGTHEIISVNVTAPASTFTAQYYEISGPTWPAATATAIGPLQGPAQGNVSLATPLGYYDLEAAPTATTPGKYYAVVIIDDQGCENVQTFTVDCLGTSPACTLATDPVMTGASVDATSIDCSAGSNSDGKHVIQSVSLQPSATYWTAEYYADPAGANTLLTTVQTSWMPTATMITPDGGDNLAAGTYAVIITDSEGCYKVNYFTIGCDDSGGRGGNNPCEGQSVPWISGTFYTDGSGPVSYNGVTYYPDSATWVNNNGNFNTPPDQVGSYFTPCDQPTQQGCDCYNVPTFNPALSTSYGSGDIVEYTNPQGQTGCFVHNGDTTGQNQGIVYYPGILTQSATGIPLNTDPINPWVLCINA